MTSSGPSRADANLRGWRARGHVIIYESDTPAGKAFDVALIAAILLSLGVVMLESVASIAEEHGTLLRSLEWFFTVLFTVEYVLRLLCVGSPRSYARSFYGLVDLFSILPTYASLLLPGARFLVVLRGFRVLRIFRVLKLVHYVTEMETLLRALRASKRKVLVFVYGVVTTTAIIGSLMYLIEGAENGFTSIPRSIYWAIVTLTTVGYGDISPQTPLGQTAAAVVMMLGWGTLAVPTGIVGVELARAERDVGVSGQACRQCSAEGHDLDARYCKHCGAKL